MNFIFQESLDDITNEQTIIEDSTHVQLPLQTSNELSISSQNNTNINRIEETKTIYTNSVPNTITMQLPQINTPREELLAAQSPTVTSTLNVPNAIGNVQSLPVQNVPIAKTLPSEPSTSTTFIPRVIDGPVKESNKVKPKSWTADDVASFLSTNDCGTYVNNFLAKVRLLCS